MDLRIVVGIDGPVFGVDVVKENNASNLLARRLALLNTKINGQDITQVLNSGVIKDAALAAAIQKRYADPENIVSDIAQNGHIVKFLASTQRTEEMCIKAVKTDAFVISHFTDAEKTEKVCIAAAKAFGQSTAFMTKAQRTEPVLIVAMKKNGLSIRHYDEDEKTPAVCEAAAYHTGRAVKYMSDAQKTHRVCLIAAKQNGHALQYLTKSQRTDDVCVAGIKENGYSARHLMGDDFSVAVAQAVKLWTPEIKSTEDIHKKADAVVDGMKFGNAVDAKEFLQVSAAVKEHAKQFSPG